MLNDFESIVREHGGRMLAVARRILRDEDAARDAVQDAFVSAYRARHQFEGTAKLSTWLHRIVVNAALMRLRSRSRQREEPLETWLPAFEDNGHHAERFQSPAENPEESLAREETRRTVRAAIDSLPEDIRARILAVQEKSGFVPNVFLALAHRPAEFRAFFAYHDALMDKEGGLNKAEREMIVVATSGANQCQYCVVAHGAILRIRAKNPLVAHYLLSRNTVLFARKHASVAQWMRLGVTISGSLARDLIRGWWRGDTALQRMLCRGYVAGLLRRDVPYEEFGLRRARSTTTVAWDQSSRETIKPEPA